MRSEPPAGYRIQLADPATLVQIQAVEQAASALFPDEDLPPALGEEYYDLEELTAAWAGGRLWTATGPDRRVVGFALSTHVDGLPHLAELDVHPDHGRRGLGSALVATVASWARAQRAVALTLTTFRHLAWNAPFYRRLGFEEVSAAALTPELGEILAQEARDGLDPAKRVAMRLPLDPPSRQRL